MAGFCFDVDPMVRAMLQRILADKPDAAGTMPAGHAMRADGVAHGG